MSDDSRSTPHRSSRGFGPAPSRSQTAREHATPARFKSSSPPGVAPVGGNRARSSGHPAPSAAYDCDVYELEFTVEPFVEGAPGPHVQAAVDAAGAAGADVEFGPFGSTCRASAADVPGIVAAVTGAALAHGATHVHLHVAAVEAS